MELPGGKNTALNSFKKVFLPVLMLIVLTTFSFYFRNSSVPLMHSVEMSSNGSTPYNYSSAAAASPMQSPAGTAAANGSSTTAVNLESKCNIFSGDWVPYPDGPHYTNQTKCVIDDRQNCMKFGRPDSEFMKWRWKPDKCELPLFDPLQFLEIVRGKTLAFVGDSVSRNQMQSLVCLLASAADPVDVSNVDDERFRRWLYKDYNFTIEAFWSPLLVKYNESGPNGYAEHSPMNLYLDEADKMWADNIENADIVIVSAGQWFFRPSIYFDKGQVVGCFSCGAINITERTRYYGYRMAFRTVFNALISLQNFKGLTFLRTFSPAHFENGDYDNGGNCVRTKPFTRQEIKLDGYILDTYLAQVEEFRAAEREGSRRGLRFRLLDTTEAMFFRPDGHPNYYGHPPQANRTVADCVHWCLPGPIDTWNEFLLQMLKMEEEQAQKKLEKNA